MSLSKRFKRIVIYGVALIMFTSVGSNLGNINISARHIRTHRKYYYHKHHQVRHNRKYRKHVNKRHYRSRKRKHKARKGYAYIIDSDAKGGQVITPSIKSLIKGNGDIGDGTDGDLVKIIGHIKINNRLFYHINDHGIKEWIYSGALGRKSNSKAHPFNVSAFSDNIWLHNIRINQKRFLKAHYHKSQQYRPRIVSPTKAKLYVNQIKNETLIDINNEREDNGIAPLRESNELDQLANIRAKQLVSNFTHYDPNNNNIVYNSEVAAELGLSINPGYGENISKHPLGESFTDKANQQANTGVKLADLANDNMMNHDMSNGNNNGHRKNILRPSYKSVGIGAYHQPNTNEFYLAEEFSFTKMP